MKADCIFHICLTSSGHFPVCVIMVDDGKLVAESDSGEFWALFRGFAPISKKNGNDDDARMESTPGKLYR